jgi:predicted nucleic acid-binding protein
MSAAVVDASVVAKWYIPERDHEAARDLRDAYLDGHHDILAPSFLPFEVINALKFSGHYDGDRLREASRTLPEYGLDLVPYRAAGPVAAVARDLDVTIYDASYVSLASTRNGMLYTADTELLDAANRGQYSAETAHIRAYESQ